MSDIFDNFYRRRLQREAEEAAAAAAAAGDDDDSHGGSIVSGLSRTPRRTPRRTPQTRRTPRQSMATEHSDSEAENEGTYDHEGMIVRAHQSNGWASEGNRLRMAAENPAATLLAALSMNGAGSAVGQLSGDQMMEVVAQATTPARQRQAREHARAYSPKRSLSPERKKSPERPRPVKQVSFRNDKSTTSSVGIDPDSFFFQKGYGFRTVGFVKNHMKLTTQQCVESSEASKLIIGSPPLHKWGRSHHSQSYRCNFVGGNSQRCTATLRICHATNASGVNTHFAIQTKSVHIAGCCNGKSGQPFELSGEYCQLIA